MGGIFLIHMYGYVIYKKYVIEIIEVTYKSQYQELQHKKNWCIFDI
jgi:hypothetical protein